MTEFENNQLGISHLEQLPEEKERMIQILMGNKN